MRTLFILHRSYSKSEFQILHPGQSIFKGGMHANTNEKKERLGFDIGVAVGDVSRL